MTGRQLLRRPGYESTSRKPAACAEHGVAVEINANPWRLDLDWRWHETALRLGCMMSINPDAHSTREIDLTHWGVEMARKGGVPKERVLNCLTRGIGNISQNGAISDAASVWRPDAAFPERTVRQSKEGIARGPQEIRSRSAFRSAVSFVVCT